MEQKILVAEGVQGFIGSNFIRNVLNKYNNCEIINLDKLTYAGNLDNLRDIESNSNYQFVLGDICDMLLVDKLITDVDIIINMAAESHVDRSIISSDDFIKTNITRTWTLLECARKNNVSKFVQIIILSFGEQVRIVSLIYGAVKEE